MDLVVLDVGNSRVKAALLRDRRVLERGAFLHGVNEPELVSFLDGMPHDAPVALVATRPKAIAALLPRIERTRRVLVAPRDFQAPVKNACLPPEGVGQDRLFNAAGALALVEEAAIVIDAGTAITVDRVEDDRTFVGGTISPGVRLCFEALHRGTERLPLLEPVFDPPEAPARNTEDAMRAGVIRGVAGLVDRLVRDLAGRDASANPTRVLLTGGDAPLLLPLLRSSPRHDPDLTLRGIAAAAHLVLAGGPA